MTGGTEDNERANIQKVNVRMGGLHDAMVVFFLINDSNYDVRCCCTFALLMPKTR